jgi:hypothetical protein
MCNAPADKFTTLYFGSGATDNDAFDKDCCELVEPDDSNEDSADDHALEGDTNAFFMEEEFMANHERIQNKLRRYKRQNKSLKKELKAERAEMEEMVVSSIQNFYKIIEKHEDERNAWSRGAMDLRKELDSVRSQQAKERREWTIENMRMQQELSRVKQDCDKAECRVQKAAEGIDELKLYNKQRQSKLTAFMQEKTRLVHENRKLKKAVLTTHGSIRAERLLK